MKILKLSNSNLANQSIEIVIPTDKDNLYYEPTDKLHKFDLIQVFYKDADKRVFILEDILGQVVLHFLNTIMMVINDEADTTEKIEPGEFGRFYNQVLFNDYINDLDLDDDIFKYILCPGIGIQIVIYTYESLVYVEAFSSFRFGENESEEDAANFKKFMENYAPIGVMKLDKKTLLQWCQQVRDFFELKNDTIPY